MKSQLKELIALNKTERVWQMPFFAGLNVAIVLFIGALFNRPDLGLVAMIGTTIFLYIPSTSIYHRMLVLMAAGFGISFTFALGLIGQFFPLLIPLIVCVVTIISSMIVRYYDLGAPGYFFFVLACILGANLPFNQSDFIMLIGLVSLGAMSANITGFIYCLLVIYVFKNNIPQEVPKRGKLGFDVIIIDPIIIGLFVGFAVFIGEVLGLERSYWVGVSCAVIMQGLTIKAVWIKQLQRIIGTFIGAGFAWYLLGFKFGNVEFALLMFTLVFMTEFLVVRNYALAIVFITPYTTYLAEAGNFMQYDPNLIVSARVVDIVLGSLIGAIGGWVLHKKRLRRRVGIFARLFFKKKFLK
ncbi:hypothetical protein CCY99_07870 [Helicobacter sp. 16-1353]|uniref:FUSC family protein n=1 Tax=Helicobacter sp. 16-1353 TaxID=2004996 RepID=UPI000DCB9B53|nr:FUSC family protein [Helicobacter sp. 16-1353]RAX52059.1 hypothetical protein CCY99_07870 [Helicobacter sp. 16-1353]